MKRDWKLIRTILLESEENANPSETEPIYMNTSDIDLQVLEEHLKMLKENAYIRNYYVKTCLDKRMYSVGCLT